MRDDINDEIQSQIFHGNMIPFTELTAAQDLRAIEFVKTMMGAAKIQHEEELEELRDSLKPFVVPEERLVLITVNESPNDTCRGDVTYLCHEDDEGVIDDVLLEVATTTELSWGEAEDGSEIAFITKTRGLVDGLLGEVRAPRVLGGNVT